MLFQGNLTRDALNSLAGLPPTSSSHSEQLLTNCTANPGSHVRAVDGSSMYRYECAYVS
jgi:hypothetical protein